jgi:hypothetical protein
VLAMSAVRNNDRVGLLLFTDQIEHVVRPRKGRRHVLRIIRDLLAFEPRGRGTDLAGALEYITRMLTHHSIVFVVSDFIATGIERPLKLLAQRHDVVAMTVEDPSERELPDVGLARFVDPETGETISIDTSAAEVRGAYQSAVGAEREARRSLLRRLAIDEVPVTTGGDVVGPLLKFFRARETRAFAGDRNSSLVAAAARRAATPVAPAERRGGGSGRGVACSRRRLRSAIGSMCSSGCAFRRARRSSSPQVPTPVPSSSSRTSPHGAAHRLALDGTDRRLSPRGLGHRITAARCSAT